MIFKSFIGLVLLILLCNAQRVAEVDFVLGAVYTGKIMYGNALGVSYQYDQIKDLMNTSLFQGYMLNSNVKGNWFSNWPISLKTPLGHKYNCSGLRANMPNPNVTCTFETQGNTTYWQILGNFVWNTQNQPNWCIGYDLQGVNLNLTSHQDIYFNWVFDVYKYTYYIPFCDELVDYGDKMVQRGYKTSYTPDDFINDIVKAGYVTLPIWHSGPGITEDASADWMLSYEKFRKVSLQGKFTVRCIVFHDPTQVTIQAILSDNATKYYLQNRFMVNQSYGYSDFTSKVAINDIKLTTGDGIDGITNTFAAALWLIDIYIEFMLMSGDQIDINHEIRPGNFQAVLDPDLRPNPIYYGMLFAVYLRNKNPQIILPSTRAVLSSKIKIFGFIDRDRFKFVILNKDTNVSLNGTVFIKSETRDPMKCFYLEAPSLDSKDGISIGGNHFVAGIAEAQGTFEMKKYAFNEVLQGYEIPIKYAQAAYCETRNTKFVWPKRFGSSFGNNMLWNMSLLGVLLFFIWTV